MNGTNAGINAHHVSVIAYTADYTEIYNGGSLISNIHVLTAASVVQDKILFRCGIGSNRRSLLKYIDSNLSFIHPDYNVLTRNSDIGIIILPWGTIPAFTGIIFHSNRIISSLQLKIFSIANIAPIALPPPNEPPNTSPSIHEQGRMVSFGTRVYGSDNEFNEVLLEGYHRVIETEQCGLWIFNETNVFCGADPIFQTNFCDSHDQGIGFLVQNRGVEYIVGITSTTTGCLGHYTGFARVQAYRYWIFDITGV